MKIGRMVEQVVPTAIYRALARAYMRVRLFGTTYYCPFCRGGFSKFYSGGFNFPVLIENDVVGAGHRDNVRCPNCNSSDRERLVYFYLINEGKIADRAVSMLHVAPEVPLQKYLKSLANVTHTSVDIESPRADKKMDIRSIQFPDNSFDVVVCNHVLEHIPEDLVAMRELLRVLKPGGFAILQVPISLKLEKTFEDFSIVTPPERERIFGQRDHVRIYARDYKDRLASAGFTVEVLNYSSKLGDEKTKLYALDPRECLYVARKAGT